MRRAAGLPALLLAALAACAAPAADAPSATPHTADSLDWLAGHWVMATSGGSVEELWLPPAGGTLYGVGRTLSGGATRFFEFLAIESREGADGPTLAYVARPRGGEPTEFLMVELSVHRAVFANPQHDFPKRISYERRGDELHARVDDGTDGGEGEDFEYRRVP
jgi:Domain of unknown function (DUF6265)